MSPVRYNRETLDVVRPYRFCFVLLGLSCVILSLLFTLGIGFGFLQENSSFFNRILIQLCLMIFITIPCLFVFRIGIAACRMRPGYASNSYIVPPARPPAGQTTYSPTYPAQSITYDLPGSETVQPPSHT